MGAAGACILPRSAINHTKFIPHLPDLSDQGQACGASLAQLVRTQHHIRAPEPSKFNQAVDQVQPERSLVLGLTNREPFPGWTDPDPVPATGRGRGEGPQLSFERMGSPKKFYYLFTQNYIPLLRGLLVH